METASVILIGVLSHKSWCYIVGLSVGASNELIYSNRLDISIMPISNEVVHMNQSLEQNCKVVVR